MISKNCYHRKIETNDLIDPHRNFVLAFQPEYSATKKKNDFS